MNCSLLETDRKISCAPHCPGECRLSRGGGGWCGTSWPHPLTPRQSSPPDLKDSVKMRLRWWPLSMVLMSFRGARVPFRKKGVYLKHDKSWKASLNLCSSSKKRCNVGNMWGKQLWKFKVRPIKQSVTITPWNMRGLASQVPGLRVQRLNWKQSEQSCVNMLCRLENKKGNLIPITQ